MNNDTPVFELSRPVPLQYEHLYPTDEGNALRAAVVLTIYGAMMLAMGIIIGQVV